jgi:type 1 glutamine amidotransferase
MGQVLIGMNPKDEPHHTKKQMPVAWTKTYTGTKGKASRVFNTTMGHGDDLKSEGFRRLLVNGCYWAMGMEDKIPARSKVPGARSILLASIIRIGLVWASTKKA